MIIENKFDFKQKKPNAAHSGQFGLFNQKKLNICGIPVSEDLENDI